MRSKLFVPASRPELFSKALASAADGLCFDLEDAVVPTRKAEARDRLAAFLRSGGLAGARQKIIVRINAASTPHFADDIRAVAQAGVDVVNLPKPRSVDDVRAAAAALQQAEQTNGVLAPIGLLLNIEEPVALRLAAELAAASPRVVGLQMGLGDMFEPLGMARRDAISVQATMFALRMAAGEAGVYAYDSAFADIADAAGYRAEAELARRMGFLGKTCIHPSQVAIANDVFRPTDAEIAHARKVLQAAREADASGAGAYVVDGKMVDAPFVARAERIVASARALDLPAG
ncbi:citryl-CoA lyase [Variovorax paradoxus]|jgi:citrate lyase subunit beta/citryl-CoA lyase|uniref:HpcH/HpaI aldolase/citrate lyase family protein n=1 Tax=Variovorax TaxID=34072 RepID=UPI0006E6E853|nr:citryl-CoA lyase [Variovorax paradoxus]KPV07258.1 citryl-CoA lyase [Variovorax paradoxus]KPV12085.1 citryl-CoA lyase [Variovorax paradoxus]KPV21318.1 citryl-CoA lyase [Variovorax paradoxus]KPV21339.1 citryl-CoA lyase [Variovorax paradoxus]